jgi:hypothetical protein
MSSQADQARSQKQETLRRVPQATFASLMPYLRSLSREDIQKPLDCPPSTDGRTWDQIRASLTALGMLHDGEATLVLRRFVSGETTLLDVIQTQMGTDVVAAVERGESCSVGLLADIHQVKSKSSIFRFESLVRMALKDQGRHPVRRQPEASIHQSRQTLNAGEAPSAHSVELTLFDLEGHHLLEALGDRLNNNDLNSARQIQKMLRELHEDMRELP